MQVNKKLKGSSTDKTIKVWDIKKRMLLKSGFLEKDKPYILVETFSTSCEMETDTDVEGVTATTRFI